MADFAGGTKLSIGDNSGLGINSKVPFDITIGKNVLMGPDVLILGQNHNFLDAAKPIIEQGLGEQKPVIIKDDVWIGARVTILPGIMIGNGAVIGAGAVVTKDVKAFDVVVGNPAQVVKNRLE